MQSQQKRVKWSRGETAEALEERTDTGITQVSVEYMENCIPDIYGNISRRPGLKLIPFADNFGTNISNTTPFFSASHLIKIIPFFISENDYILVGLYESPAYQRMMRIKDNKCVYYHRQIANWTYGFNSKITGYAQQNNYLIVSDGYKTFKLTISFPNGINNPEFTPNWEMWSYTGGWYAPNGTATQAISNVNLPGLSISGHFSNYSYVNPDGTSTMYSVTTTGLSNSSGLEAISSAIAPGSIVQLPNIGAYFRVEGYIEDAAEVGFNGTTFSAVVNNSTIPSGHVAAINVNGLGTGVVGHYYNGTLQSTVSVPAGKVFVVKCTASSTGYSSCGWYKTTIMGHETTMWSGWTEQAAPSTAVRMYGSLLTPVVDENATDTSVNVEYGYVSLTPSSFGVPGYRNDSFPTPTKFCFSEQRLWAGEWAVSATESYPLTIGSQIARYNDFKNDYNQDNEAITLDIVTQKKEKILHLIDYNGLKIFTDSFEYAYDSTGVRKQSAHGSLDICDPIIFGSLCLFADKTGGQILAMQYEFQNNLFDSACINQLAPKDLIWYPTSLSSFEDKINNTGKYLFVMNDKSSDAPDIAVCNFVPGNQANIWSRWSFQRTNNLPYQALSNDRRVFDVLTVGDKALFLVYVDARDNSSTSTGGLLPAELDFSAKGDLEATAYQEGLVPGYAYLDLGHFGSSGGRFTLAKATEVMVFSDGEYVFTTTTNLSGMIVDDLSSLTNITFALPIKSTIVSHPIDVGGKTKSIMKRVGKAQMSVHDTESGVISINNKTGYMNPRQDHICFYGVSGFKDELKYTITNKNGAIFHLESLLMNIEYGTLDS